MGYLEDYHKERKARRTKERQARAERFGGMFYDKEKQQWKVGKIVGWCVGAVVGLVGLIIVIGLIAGIISRYEKREDAKNEVTVTRTLIKKAEEEAKVNKAQIKATEAEAEKRVAESVGIKEAQLEINKTLTDKYIQHEYVQAIEKGHVETTFIPVGQNGLPFVTDPTQRTSSGR